MQSDLQLRHYGIAEGYRSHSRMPDALGYDAALALRYRSGCRTLFTLGLFSNISWVTMLSTAPRRRHARAVANVYCPVKRLRSSRRERITHGAFVPVHSSGCSPARSAARFARTASRR